LGGDQGLFDDNKKELAKTALGVYEGNDSFSFEITAKHDVTPQCPA
jgi:hypothetical protein